MKIDIKKSKTQTISNEFDRLLEDLEPDEKELMENTINQLRNQEQIVKNQLKRLKEIDHQKEEFLSMISHELKTPLTPIIGWCEALKTPKILGELSLPQIEAVDTIYSNAMKLKQLIGDLLDVQKLELGKMQFHHTEFSIEELLKNLLADFRYVLNQEEGRIINLYEGNLLITNDRQRILQVLTNIVNNAIDFVQNRTGIIELNVKDEGDLVIFSVKDNGIGISKDKQKDLFKKFYQIDTNVTRQHGGTGLGLTVCKGIVEGLGGKIWVQSTYGKGSIFYFSIPKIGGI